MPVEGYEHKHLWLYRSKFRYPWPLTPMLDQDWDGLDQDWEFDVLDRLGRGEAALGSVPVNDLVRSYGPGAAAEGWEAAEARAEKADRSGSPFLNDYAIARRLPDRERRKKAHAEFLAEDQVRREKDKARREAEQAKWAEIRKEEAAERAEADRVWREAKAEWDRVQAERDAEWRRIEEEKPRLAAAKEERQRREVQAILTNKWQCQRCWGVAQINPQGAGFALQCPACGAKAWGSHTTLVGMLPP